MNKTFLPGRRRDPRHLPVGLRRRGEPPATLAGAAGRALGGRARDGAHRHRHGRPHRAALRGAHAGQAGLLRAC